MPHRQHKIRVKLPDNAYNIGECTYNRYDKLGREWDIEKQDWIHMNPPTERSLRVKRQNDLFARMFGWKDDNRAS